MEHPSVTELLAACNLGPDYSRVPVATMDHAKLRGQALHLAIRYALEGILDESSVHPQIQGGFAAFRRFERESGFKPLDGWVERELIHPAWKFRGHPDAVGHLNGGLALVDWKTNSFDERATRLQLAGYSLLYQAAGSDEPLAQCVVVELHLDGTYRVVAIEAKSQEQTFLAALVVFRALQEKGRS